MILIFNKGAVPPTQDVSLLALKVPPGEKVRFWGKLLQCIHKKAANWRSSFLSASILWGVLIASITEILSIFKILTFWAVLLSWGIAAIILFSIYYFVPQKKNENANAKLTIPAFLKILLAGVLVIVILTLLIALVAPPNTWDSMTYHMSRVVHWIQNQSVDHYPTHISRQLWQSPWAEFAITHFQILSNGDYLANIVQWLCMLGSILGVTLIAKEFGAELRGQIFAAVTVVTLPMGILQSSSTQNDYVVSFWLVCFVYFSIRFKNNPKWSYSLAIGASLALAILTKGTAYIYAFPFLLLIILTNFKAIRWKLFKYIFLISLIVVLVNIGHYRRNIALFGNPLATGGIKMSNDKFDLSVLISNISRNVALHTATPFKIINKITGSSIELLHSTLGIDINDPKTTWKGVYSFPRFSNSENTAGNPFHLLLIMISIFFCFSHKGLRREPNLLSYICSLILGFLLFCLYLMWQQWHSRLHLPLFVMWSPIIGVVLSTYRKKLVSNCIILALLIFSLPWVMYNLYRPLITKDSILITDRLDQYFKSRPYLKSSYHKVAAFIAAHECHNVGLKFGEDDGEYPLWVLIDKYAKRMPRIEHVRVKWKSGKITFRDFKHCVFVQFKGKGNNREIFVTPVQ